MVLDLVSSFKFDTANLTLKQAYAALEGDQETDIPFLVWLLENPDSPLALPGKIYLQNHDYIHILLGREQSAQDEAFVIGFTMGNDSKTNWLHLAIFKLFAKFLYPKIYRFSNAELQVFKLGFAYGRKLKTKHLNEFDFQSYQNETIASIRQKLGIRADEIMFLQCFESWLIPNSETSKKLVNSFWLNLSCQMQ